ARRGGVQPPIDRERLPEISVIDVPIESRPRLPGVAGAIQPVATGGNVGLGIRNEHVMNVVLNARAPLGPRFPLVFAHVDAADLDAGYHPFWRICMGIETSDMGLVAVARRMPVLAAGEVL